MHSLSVDAYTGHLHHMSQAPPHISSGNVFAKSSCVCICSHAFEHTWLRWSKWISVVRTASMTHLWLPHFLSSFGNDRAVQVVPVQWHHMTYMSLTATNNARRLLNACEMLCGSPFAGLFPRKSALPLHTRR